MHDTTRYEAVSTQPGGKEPGDQNQLGISTAARRCRRRRESTGIGKGRQPIYDSTGEVGPTEEGRDGPESRT